MDPRLIAQDVVRCDQCKDNVVESYCDLCHVKLCKPCIGEHISDDNPNPDKHIIVSFQQRKSTLIFPICKTHSTETCKLQCMSCNIFICAKCSISEHKDHHIMDLEYIYNSKKANIELETEEFENIISPTYEEIKNESQIAGLDGEYEKLTKIMTKQGEEWHDEIDRTIKQMKNKLNDIKVNHRDILNKHLKEIKEIESLIKENLGTLKDIQRESNIVSKVMVYKSRNKYFCKLLPKEHVVLPSFCPNPMEKGKVENLIGSINPLFSTIDENGYKLKKQRMPYRDLLDTPKLINTFNTGYKFLRSVPFTTRKKYGRVVKVIR